MNATLVLLAMLIGVDADETAKPFKIRDKFSFNVIKLDAAGIELFHADEVSVKPVSHDESGDTPPLPAIAPPSDVTPEDPSSVPPNTEETSQEDSKKRPTFWHNTFTLMPERPVHGTAASGQFGVFAYDLGTQYASDWNAEDERNQTLLDRGQFNYRSWMGPTNPSLPSNAFRIAFDFPITLNETFQFGFTPAIVSDFDGHLNGDGYNWDFRLIGLSRQSEELLIVWGIEFWNRVDNFLIPHAGIVWTPSERFTLQLMAPKSRISFRLDDNGEIATWAYGSIEYNVEAYQISLTSPVGHDEKIQLADYRAVFGVRGEGSKCTSFIEGGWVFNRQVIFLHGTPGFSIDPGFVGSIGIRF